MTLPTPLIKGMSLTGQTMRGLLNRIDSPAVILLYHRVIDLANDPQLLAVSPNHFYQQMNFMKENYNLLTVEEFKSNLRQKKPFTKNSVLVTFDDGYADNLHHALPVLEQSDSQALFFISTGHIGTDREFWWDDLERILLSPAELPATCPLKIGGHSYEFDTSKAHRHMTYQKIHPLMKMLNFADREDLLHILYRWSGLSKKGRGTHRVLNDDEILKLSRSKSVVVGAHTQTHCALSTLSYAEQLENIQQSKIRLEKITGQPVEYFSYPFGGKEDYDTNSLKIVKQLNFQIVMANYYGHVHRWTDKYQIPRIIVRNWDLETFKQKIDQFFRY